MMKSNELRIGNWARFTAHDLDYVSQVRGVSQYVDHLNNLTTSIMSRSDESNLDYSHTEKQVNPIPITEQWLIDFGFKREEEDSCHWFEMDLAIIKLISNDIGKEGYSEKLEFLFDFEFDKLRIEYVHQLQNLYFALTGEELTKQ